LPSTQPQPKDPQALRCASVQPSTASETVPTGVSDGVSGKLLDESEQLKLDTDAAHPNKITALTRQPALAIG
jgi:hypothetical protein